MAKEHLIALKKDSKTQELVGLLCAHAAKIIKTTSAIIFLTLTPQLLNVLNAATKAEVRAFLDAKDGITPGQKDSIQYT